MILAIFVAEFLVKGIRIWSFRGEQVPPYHLAQKLGFVIESGPLQPTPAFVLTECPAATNEGLDSLLLQLKSHVNAVNDYLASVLPLWLKASRLKLAAKAVEQGGSRRLLKEKKFSPGRCA